MDSSVPDFEGGKNSSITCVTPSRSLALSLSLSLSHTHTHTHTGGRRNRRRAAGTRCACPAASHGFDSCLTRTFSSLLAHQTHIHSSIQSFRTCALVSMLHVHTYVQCDASNSCSTLRYIERERERERERRTLDYAGVLSTLAARPQHRQQHLVSLLRLSCLQT